MGHHYTINWPGLVHWNLKYDYYFISFQQLGGILFFKAWQA